MTAAANRLAAESSPYLLQHQHNPVDWYPWGAEAFEAARRLDRPIFLSVGYSTCYWCHVMERQSFENEAIAAEMNQRFVNVKVDREERPDVDQLYMTAVQLLTRQGGWPMSVFLLPDLRPFYGGTYFPPTDQYGRPGFPTLLRAIDDAYRGRRPELEGSAVQIVDVLRRLAAPARPAQALRIDQQFIGELIDRSIADYDSSNGGFGAAPKFPRQTLLELLLVYLATAEKDLTPAAASRRVMVQRVLFHTLDALAHGGIRDHLGGGFHRYSTDAQWLVPHFEIMLYDNAMLAWCYVEAFRQTRDPRWAEVARGILDFVLRELTAPDGGFHTALDAEVDAKEGESYLWTPAEVAAVLVEPADYELFSRAYGLNRGFNFSDPHHGSGTPDKNILYLPVPLPALATQIGMKPADLSARLAGLRLKLRAARATRRQPRLDNKILTSWNALMIRALAHAADVLQEPVYAEAGSRAAGLLWDGHRRPDGMLLRTSGGGTARGSSRAIPGFLDDYAFFAQALFALAGATGDASWREKGERVVAELLARFGDGESTGGFFFTDRSSDELIVRQKAGADSPLPSGNAVAAMVLVEQNLAASAGGVLGEFAQQLQSQGEGMGAMVQAAMLYVEKHGTLDVRADSSADAAADRPLSPGDLAERVVTVRTSWESPDVLHLRLEILRGFHINAHQQGDDHDLVHTALSFSGVGAEVAYPPGEERQFPFSAEPIRVYSGQVSIRATFTQPARGQVRQATLSYQACDDSACLLPVKKQIPIAG